MKKQLLIILSVILLLSFAAGCSVNNETNVTINNSISIEKEEKSEEAFSVSKTTVSKKKETTSKKKEKTKKTTKAQKTTTTQKSKETTTKKEKTTKPKPQTTKQKETTKKPSKTTSKAKTVCYLTIECKSILDNMNKLKSGHEQFVPQNGIILGKTECEFKKGESVFDVLERTCSQKGIDLNARNTQYYIYVAGINYLDEFDCGSASGWVYTVNSVSPNKSCGKYTVSNGDYIVFKYVC